jgi:hypothetical protein
VISVHNSKGTGLLSEYVERCIAGQEGIDTTITSNVSLLILLCNLIDM